MKEQEEKAPSKAAVPQKEAPVKKEKPVIDPLDTPSGVIGKTVSKKGK